MIKEQKITITFKCNTCKTTGKDTYWLVSDLLSSFAGVNYYPTGPKGWSHLEIDNRHFHFCPECIERRKDYVEIKDYSGRGEPYITREYSMNNEGED